MNRRTFFAGLVGSVAAAFGLAAKPKAVGADIGAGDSLIFLSSNGIWTMEDVKRNRLVAEWRGRQVLFGSWNGNLQYLAGNPPVA